MTLFLKSMLAWVDRLPSDFTYKETSFFYNRFVFVTDYKKVIKFSLKDSEISILVCRNKAR